MANACGKYTALAFYVGALTACAMNSRDAGRAAPSTQTAPAAGEHDMRGMQGMDHSGAGSAMGGTDAGMAGMDHPQMGGMDQSKMPGMDHSKMHGMDHPSSGPSAAGRPGDPSPVDRTVNVTALDTMRFEPSSLEVKPGETIRFVVTNAGKLPHEFVIGTYEEQSEHAAMMKKMPRMAHRDANSLRLQPGETKTLVWQFDQGGRVQIACHEPGHYEAGMVAQVNVGTAAGNRTAPAQARAGRRRAPAARRRTQAKGRQRTPVV